MREKKSQQMSTSIYQIESCIVLVNDPYQLGAQIYTYTWIRIRRIQNFLLWIQIFTILLTKFQILKEEERKLTPS
jgi:hypothetical protein